MPFSDSKADKCLNFKIQLLSGKNIVLVECAGFESELFMPQIIKGRINLKNIIPGRRCCDSSNLSSPTVAYKCRPENSNSTRPAHSNVTIRKMTYNQTYIASPLARSTPSSTASGNGKENKRPSLPAPEQVRGLPYESPSINDVLFSRGTSSSPSVAPQARIPHPLDSVEQSKCDQTILECQLAGMNSSETPQKAASIRTYSRRKSVSANLTQQCKGSSKPKSNSSWHSPVTKKRKSLTKTPNPTMKLEVRNRKLIVDTNKSLGSVVRRNMVESPISKKKISKKQVTAKTRKQYCALKGTAYDQLTTPSITNISNDLIAQFQLACMDKKATTLPSYAQIANVPPLFVDREVKSLLVRQKRLKKS